MPLDWRGIFDRFADLLAYPGPRLSGQAGECSALLARAGGGAHGAIGRFMSAAAGAGPGRLEEIYTETFDLQPICPPYLGCYLFSEDRIRGMFMVRLKERYRDCGLPLQQEMPDHLVSVLRFLTRAGDTEEVRELLDYCLLPVVGRMIGRFPPGGGNPYETVLRALLECLQRQRAALRGGRDTAAAPGRAAGPRPAGGE